MSSGGLTRYQQQQKGGDKNKWVYNYWILIINFYDRGLKRVQGQLERVSGNPGRQSELLLLLLILLLLLLLEVVF